MKKLMLLAGVACLFAANANAGVNQYVSGKLSYDFNKVKYQNTEATSRVNMDKKEVGTHFAYGVQAGYVRGELELNNSRDIRRNVDGNHFRLYKHSVMANAYFDYLTCTPWTPYVGAGLGSAYLKTQNTAGHKSVYNLAWQAMAGLTYDVNANWTLDAGYRYADLGRVRKNHGDWKEKTTARDHEILLGVRYTF